MAIVKQNIIPPTGDLGTDFVIPRINTATNFFDMATGINHALPIVYPDHFRNFAYMYIDNDYQILEQGFGDFIIKCIGAYTLTFTDGFEVWETNILGNNLYGIRSTAFQPFSVTLTQISSGDTLTMSVDSGGNYS